MAGRGTDIVLGGSLEAELTALGEEADDAAKLKARECGNSVTTKCWPAVVAYHRHRTSRVAPYRQSVARPFRTSGRCGFVRFYLSLQDSLMRIFASDRMAGLMQKLGMQRVKRSNTPGFRALSKMRSARWKGTTSIFANSCSNTTTWPMTSVR